MVDKCMVVLICVNKMNAFVIKQSLGNDFNLLIINSHDEAIQKISAITDKICTIIFCESGITDKVTEFTSQFKSNSYADAIPLVMLMPKEKCETNARKCYELGFTEVIEMPFDPFYFKTKIKTLKNIYSHAVSNSMTNNDMSNIIINILSTVFEFIQFEPSTHITRVKGLTSIISVTFADMFPEYNLDDDDIKYISQASALHDIGKSRIPTNILFKAGKLTDEEFDIMRTHTKKGAEILQEFGLDNSHPFFSYAFDICRYHHERWDGKGYPFHLEKDHIPIAAQIVSIVDVYDALISERVYKAAIPYEKALIMIREGQCGFFPPKIIEAFNACEKRFRNYLEESLNVKIIYESKK